MLARIHCALMQLYMFIGSGAEARLHGEQAITFAGSANERAVEWAAHWGIAVLSGLTGNAGDLARHVSEAQRIAEELRSPVLGVWTNEVSIEYASGIGDWNAGLSLAERTIPVARAVGARTLLPRLLVWTGLMHLGRGELEKANALFEESWSIVGRRGHRAPHRGREHRGPGAHGHGRVCAGDRRLQAGDRVRRGWRRAGRSLRATSRGPFTDSSRSSSRRRSGSRTSSARSAMASGCDATRRGWATRWVAPGRPRAMRSSRDSGQRRPSERSSCSARRQTSWTPFHSCSMPRAFGAISHSCSPRVDDREGATRELRRAHDVFARIGAETELRAHANQLRELGARPPAKAIVEGAGSLTGREREIARLVAARKSNKEIGAALSISSTNREHASLECLRETRCDIAWRADRPRPRGCRASRLASRRLALADGLGPVGDLRRAHWPARLHARIARSPTRECR